LDVKQRRERESNLFTNAAYGLKTGHNAMDRVLKCVTSYQSDD